MITSFKGSRMLSMDFYDLDRLATGDLPAAEAKAILAQFLSVVSDETIPSRIYTVFRAWVWKALRQRRDDDELRLWYTLMRSTADTLRSKRYHSVSDKIVPLYELVDESITVSETLTPSELLNRPNVSAVVCHLALLEMPTSRAALMECLNLESDEVDRVLIVLKAAGLVEAEALSATSALHLTYRGRAVAAEWSK